jgi:prepilin-type N-terminal cleavage/methylation domain-containing protein
MEFSKETNSLKAGFSLIELGITMAIIALLTLGVFRAYRKISDSRAESKTTSRLASLDQELDRYKTAVGDYPRTLDELSEGPKGTLARRWGGTNLEAEDLVDAWDQPFEYAPHAKGARPPYDLSSAGTPGSDKPNRIYSPRSQS